MRKVVLLFWLAFPGLTFGQSTLNFPRAFTPSDLASTGFAIVNPGSSDALVTFTLRNANGETIVTRDEAVAAGGQLAKLGSPELFSSPAADGWVQVTSATTGLQGFWLGGDFTSFTDGASAAPSAADLVIPLAGTNTEINIANTAAVEANVTISLHGASGAEMDTASQSIPGTGVFKATASNLFSGVDLTQATHIRIAGGTSIAATAIVEHFLVNPAWGVVNGVSASSTTTELNFAHVVSGPGGGGNWLTTVGVTNLTSSPATVNVTFTPCGSLETCPEAATTVQVPIAANGSIRDSAQNLFSFPASEFKDGWIRVQSTVPVTGFVAYAEAGAKGLAIVPAQQSPLTSMLFAHVAQATGWLTGVALLNTSTTTANVEVFAMNSDGTLIGGAQDSPAAAFMLAPGQKIARLLNDPWIPNANSNGGFVFVRTTNDVPLFGIELFLRDNLELLANVTAGGLAPGITYTPPPPAGMITLNSLSPTRVARGEALTLNGSGFSATASNNNVFFTTAAGSTSVSAATATSTILTVIVPNTAISGPVYVESGAAASSSKILEVTETATTLVQSEVTVSASQTTTGVDIYVPPSGTLNITQIGAGSRFGSISFASSSVELTRGQTTDLLVAGTGLSLASGLALSISGGDVSVSDVLFQDDHMFVQISIAINAALGPRTVKVTNANLDTSVLSGGIIIRE